MLRILLSMLLAGWVPAQGETLTPFGIDVDDGWVQEAAGDRISIYAPNGNGILKIQSFSATGLVDKERLRNLTNVDRSTPLTWQDWGDFSGYQMDYSEGASFFRQWWLANKSTLIFAVYESSVAPEDSDIDDLDKIINSMTVSAP